jgi:hypothetical protein
MSTSPYSQLAPLYLDEPHRNILRMMETSYEQSISIGQTYWYQANQDIEYYAGNQSAWSTSYGVGLPESRKKQYNFNRIRPIINSISGHQRRNRKSSVVTPIENGDAETADQFTKILMWINQQEGVLNTISDAFEGSLITGLTLLHTYLDYRDDPVSGNIKVDALSFNQFLIDPFFRKQDLSDCNFVWRRSFLTKRECISLVPDQEETIMSLTSNTSVNGRDAKFQFMPETYNPAITDLLTYDEYYYRDYRTQIMLADTETGEVIEWKSNDKDALKEFVEQNPTVSVLKQEIPTVNMALVIQGKVVYTGSNPNGSDKYPFVPVMCYFHPEMVDFPNRIQGITRGLRDAQYCYNRRKVIELDILESQLNSGFIMKENALVNPNDAYLTGQGRTLFVKQNASMADVQRLESPAIPPTTLQVSETLAKEMNYISGVSEESMGMAADEVSGILAMLRMKASNNSLEGVFDQLDRSQALLARIHMDYIQTNFTPGKIQKILEGKQPAPQFYNKAFGRYHVAIEDGLNTSTQRQMQLAQMVSLKAEAGINFSEEDMLEASTLQNKKQILDNLAKQKQQAMQQQQQVQQAQLRVMETQAQDNEAKAEANRGLGLERASRVEENHALAVERRAAAIKDQDIGLLNLVKAMKEIETTDISHIKELFTLSNLLTERQRMEEATNPASTDKESSAIAAVSSRSRQPQQPPQQAPELQQGGMQI